VKESERGGEKIATPEELPEAAPKVAALASAGSALAPEKSEVSESLPETIAGDSALASEQAENTASQPETAEERAEVAPAKAEIAAPLSLAAQERPEAAPELAALVRKTEKQAVKSSPPEKEGAEVAGAVVVSAAARIEKAPPLVRIRGLKVALPGGRVLLQKVSLALHPGEVVVLLGGSGAGKSTFSRVLFEPESLVADGFSVEAEELSADASHLGLVPQRGALFDHLDVAGNLSLALRYGRHQRASREEVAAWLARVGLDPSLAEHKTPVGSLSGGQAQRVAVARTLAGGREVLFLDEPSVGLDPLRVRSLARLLREQVRAQKAAAIVVTHDVALAAGVADTLYFLDPEERRFVPLFEGEWPGPQEVEEVSPEARGAWVLRLEQELCRRIAAGEAQGAGGRASASSWWNSLRERLVRPLRPFAVAGGALWRAPWQAVSHPGDFVRIWWRVLWQALARPLLFYLVVSSLVGYTLLYVVSKVGGGEIPPDRLIAQLGGSYIVALAPVLSALLFVAASGSASNAWLGGVHLTKQAAAMRALGIDPRRYLAAPAWVALAVSYLCVVLLFAGGMLAGGLALCRQLDVPNAYELLSADLLDPRPDRSRYLGRALFLGWIYAWGIASDTVAKGFGEKREAEDVTRAMTQSVVACTLWVVLWELASALVIFSGGD
jgi:thiamine transport system ATP-binding protein